MTLSRKVESQSTWAGLAVSILLTTRSVASAHALPRQINTTQLLPNYDYVIVGGGTAGLTLADRLTEDPGTNVLVLEAGGWGNASEILTVFSQQINVTEYLSTSSIESLYSVPQVNLGPDNAIARLAIGRVVGGGSAVNGMYNMRGSVEDYDRWDHLFATEGQNSTITWGWESMMPYFKKGLHFTPPPPELTEHFDSVKYDASYWGNTSEIYGGWPKFYWPGVTPLLEAFKEIEGVEFPPDSGAGQPGVYWFPSLVDPRSETRSYARTGHYSNVNSSRPNYHLLINTEVRRVLLDDSLTATGVEFPSDNSTLVTISADKEVILAAGTVHTPQLLQLSGIGPKNILEDAGIEVLVDLPGVGQNFQDHTQLSTLNITIQGLSNIHPNLNDLTPGSDFQDWADEVWAANKSGPYTIAYSNLAAWLPLTVISDDAEALAATLEQQNFASILPAEADSTVVAGYAAQMQTLATQIRSGNSAFARIQFQAESGIQGPVLLQPLSRGTININTTDPWNSKPIVDFRALSNHVESDIYVELIKFYRQFNFNTSLASEYSPVEFVPGSNVTSDQDLKSYISSSLATTDYHPVGTCSMLPQKLGGVVDQTLRVYGVKNLRVIDGSVIPMLPSANTCQPIYAIAEKAADLIKQGVPRPQGHVKVAGSPYQARNTDCLLDCGIVDEVGGQGVRRKT